MRHVLGSQEPFDIKAWFLQAIQSLRLSWNSTTDGSRWENMGDAAACLCGLRVDSNRGKTER